MSKSRGRAGSANDIRPLLNAHDLVLNAQGAGDLRSISSKGSVRLEDEDFSHIDLRLPDDEVASGSALLIDEDALKNGISGGVIGTPMVRTVAAANVLTYVRWCISSCAAFGPGVASAALSCLRAQAV
jgi:hypothetical protein